MMMMINKGLFRSAAVVLVFVVVACHNAASASAAVVPNNASQRRLKSSKDYGSVPPPPIYTAGKTAKKIKNAKNRPPTRTPTMAPTTQPPSQRPTSSPTDDYEYEFDTPSFTGDNEGDSGDYDFNDDYYPEYYYGDDSGDGDSGDYDYTFFEDDILPDDGDDRTDDGDDRTDDYYYLFFPTEESQGRSSACEDSTKTFRLKRGDKNTYTTMKDCAWMMEAKDAKLKCDWYTKKRNTGHVYVATDEKARDVCPKTCGSCSTSSSP